MEADASQEQTSLWVVDHSRSPVDDSPEVLAFLTPKEATTSYVAKPRASLVVACQDNKTKLYVVTSMYLISDQVEVVTRIDNAQAEKNFWSISTDRRAAGLWRGQQSIPLLRKLKDSDRLFVRIRDKDVTDATYDLTGVGKVVDAVAEACNWSPT